MVFRVYVSKKAEFANEERSMLNDIRKNLGIVNLEDIKIYNRYDVEGIDEETFQKTIKSVFSEPQVDDVCFEVNDEGIIFGIEFLPGQFDQRADSAQQCIQFVTGGVRPTCRCAKVIVLKGGLEEKEVARIKAHIINPVEMREASLEKFETLENVQPVPEKTPYIEGFINMTEDKFASFIKEYGLAMDTDDVAFCQNYFKNEEKRDPSLTELKMIDTYWSDHCRHTTFMTQIDEIKIEHAAVKASYDKYLEIKEQLYPS